MHAKSHFLCGKGNKGLALGAPQGTADDSPTGYQHKLAQRVPPFNAVQKSFCAALLEIVYRYQVPLALEYVDRDAATKRLGFVLSGATVRTAIETLARHQPGYRVTFTGGIVDVYSPRARADPSDLLNKRIPTFDYPRADIALAASMLYGTLLNTIGPPTGFGGSVAGVVGPPVAINVKGLRVFAILNMLVARQGTQYGSHRLRQRSSQAQAPTYGTSILWTRRWSLWCSTVLALFSPGPAWLDTEPPKRVAISEMAMPSKSLSEPTTPQGGPN